MSELTKGFGVYSLPIRVVRYTQRNGKTILTLYMGEKINNYLLSTNRSHVFPVLEFMAKSANLMPEAVEVIRDLVKIVSQPDYDPDSLDYADYVVQRAKELLAKLEGGADDATNP